MKSMTGIGVCRVRSDGLSVDVSLRSVNGRFLDSKIILPSEFQVLEKALRDHLAKTISRGSVSLVVSCKRKGSSSRKVRYNKNLAKQAFDTLSFAARDLGLEKIRSLDTFNRVIEIISVENAQLNSPRDNASVMSAFRGALAKLEVERRREGGRLLKDLMARVRSLEKQLVTIQELRSQFRPIAQKRMTARIQELLASKMEGSRLAEEVLYHMDRTDISEEITRLREHLTHFRKLLASSVSEGKKLDFYTQELLREVNTIGSKANDARITKSVIESKALIEQIKEQVQNIE